MIFKLIHSNSVNSIQIYVVVIALLPQDCKQLGFLLINAYGFKATGCFLGLTFYKLFVGIFPQK